MNLHLAMEEDHSSEKPPLIGRHRDDAYEAFA